MSEIEGVLLTGGASSRMGADKAKIVVDGEPLAARIARLMMSGGLPVTVLGREPIDGCEFLADEQEYAGPLVALSRFAPRSDLVFVASCDLPGFDPGVIAALHERLGGHDAAIPVVEGRLQPLCALYRSGAFANARELAKSGERRMMRWLDSLLVVQVDGIDARWVANVNSPEHLKKFGIA